MSMHFHSTRTKKVIYTWSFEALLVGWSIRQSEDGSKDGQTDVGRGAGGRTKCRLKTWSSAFGGIVAPGKDVMSVWGEKWMKNYDGWYWTGEDEPQNSALTEISSPDQIPFHYKCTYIVYKYTNILEKAEAISKFGGPYSFF